MSEPRRRQLTYRARSEAEDVADAAEGDGTAAQQDAARTWRRDAPAALKGALDAIVVADQPGADG